MVKHPTQSARSPFTWLDPTLRGVARGAAMNEEEQGPKARLVLPIWQAFFFFVLRSDASFLFIFMMTVSKNVLFFLRGFQKCSGMFGCSKPTPGNYLGRLAIPTKYCENFQEELHI